MDEDPLQCPVQYLRGVGPIRAERLRAIGIQTVADVLTHIPFRYEDRTSIRPISDLKPGEKAVITARVKHIDVEARARFRKGGPSVTALLEDDSGDIEAVWFGPAWTRGYLVNQLEGKRAVFVGRVKEFRHSLQIVPEEYEVLDDDSDAATDSLSVGRIVPFHHATEGISFPRMRHIANQAVTRAADVYPEILPEEMRNRLQMIPVSDSFRWIHFPSSQDEIRAARRRLAFEELLVFQVGMAVTRSLAVSGGHVDSFRLTDEIDRRIRRRFPFKLTPAQEKAVAEIARDMAGPYAMNRLLQGDVGCGKTAVAIYAMLLTVAWKAQAAVMVPTEILAEQHFDTLSRMLAGSRVRLALLTSATRGRKRRELMRHLADGTIDIVVGTHALQESAVKFKRLGLVVVDEQHKFGVIQRGKLRAKGKRPHVLVMTATPIPRSVALTAYGDLDLTEIKGMPPGRAGYDTEIVTGSGRREAYARVRSLLDEGRQAYAVFPLVDETPEGELKAATESAERFRNGAFRRFRVGLAHGRMRPEERGAVIEAFRAGDVHLLVATVVIEVGVDVPNATLMMVEHAERFGLSQLHQLRGRVGRGRHRGLCVLFGDARSPEAVERLSILERTDDGFEVAEADFRIRGPGQFFGTRQHGVTELKVANLLEDKELVVLAREEARKIVAEDPKLASPELALLKERVREVFGRRIRLAEVG